MVDLVKDQLENADGSTRAVLVNPSGGYPADALQQQFEHSLAVIIGINAYKFPQKVRMLHTARPDAAQLAALLQDDRRDPLDRYEMVPMPLYDEQATGDALREYLPDASWIEPDGGFFLSVNLPAGVTSEALQTRAAEVGLGLSDGRGFFPTPADGERFLRLPFCALTPEQIHEGVRRLAGAVRDVAERQHARDVDHAEQQAAEAEARAERAVAFAAAAIQTAGLAVLDSTVARREAEALRRA